MSLVKRLCPISSQLHTVRHVTLGSNAYNPFRGKFPDPEFKTKRSRRANRPLRHKVFKEVLTAQRQRRPWEYPVQPDQRASWKHSKWMDPYLGRWVSTLPDPMEDQGFYSEKGREPLRNCDNVKELHYMMLEGFKGDKFVIPAFDQNFPQLNMSYFTQYLTHTKYVHGLPYHIEQTGIDDSQFEDFVTYVEQLLLFKHNSCQHSSEIEDIYQRKTKADSELMKSIVNYLSSSQLKTDAQLSFDTETSMLWLRGRGYIKKYIPKNAPKVYQTHDRQILQVTSKERLPSFSEMTSTLSNTGNIPFYTFSPYLLHEETNYRNMISTGKRLFAGDTNVNYQEAYDEEKLSELPPPIYSNDYFGHTQVCLLPPTYSREWYEDNLEHGDITSEIEEHLKSYGMMSGWTWTASQASYAGHYMDNDVTEPWCSQVVVFDGKYLSVFCYQLNTLAIEEEHVNDHQRRNLCFGKTSMPLFEEVTDSGVTGLNMETLKTLFNIFSQKDVAQIPKDEVAVYENNLPVQEVNVEKPDLEDQKPLHIVQLEEEEQQRLLEEEEREKLEWESKSLQTKLRSYAEKVPLLIKGK